VLPELLADYRTGRAEAIEACIKERPAEVPKEEF
jgi:hypothetical protein